MRIKRTALFAAAVTALVVPAVILPQTANAHHPGGGGSGGGGTSEARVLATGLQGTSGGTIGPDGALYVTEATIGQITRIDTRTGEASVFASGLPPAVVGLGGAIDVAFVGSTAYALVSLVNEDVGGTSISGIYRVDDTDSFTVIVDLAAWSTANPPATPFDQPGGLQFALQTVRGGFLVTDGHHNRVLRVTLPGRNGGSAEVSQVAQFDNIVPTGLAVSGRTVYVAQAGPVPHDPSTGKVVSFDLGSPQPSDVASGYSLLTDVEFGKCDVLYALSQGDSPGIVSPGEPALRFSGELLRVVGDGAFAAVVDGLDLPTSVDFARDTAYIVANGEVLTVRNVGTGSGRHGWRDNCRGGGHHHDQEG